MNDTHHQGSVRCNCWHSTNPRILLSGGDDRTIRLWRLYPHNSLYQSTKKQSSSRLSTPEHEAINKTKRSESEDSIELRYDELSNQLSDDDDPNKFITDFDPSIQPMSHLLSMPASGEVKGICMSPYNGEILVATSSRLFNQKSSLDILNIPHWTWNYSSNKRIPYRQQLKEKILQKKEGKKNKNENKNGINLLINSLDDELELKKEEKLNPFIENQKNNKLMRKTLDFIDRPSVIPLPYGARERCITFSPSQNIVFVGLLSCRKKHQRRYCCLMACNIQNGASRACKKINALLFGKECIYSIKLTNANKIKNKYRLALGTNLGRLIIVTLKEDLKWINTRKSFINEYTIGYENDTLIYPNNPNKNNNQNNNGIRGINNNKNSKNSQKNHHRKTSSRSGKYSVLTSRERIFREMADPTTVMITYESMRKYLWNESSQIEENDINEFFIFMKPNKKNQITFTQFVQKIDEDGNFMRAFEQFCLVGSSRTDRRAWMDNNNNQSDIDDNQSDDSDWIFAMENKNKTNKNKTKNKSPITAIEWSKYDNWIITGHQNGDIQFWNKEYYNNSQAQNNNNNNNNFINQSNFYYINRGAMRRHCENISSLTLSGTYLVSSSCDGNILIWHLDFLLPMVTLPINITLKSKGIIQLLATINSAHLGDEICDVKLSKFNNNIQYCIPNALYLLSCGADENIRCRDVMEILRQQLTLRILSESNHNNNNHQQNPKYDTYTAINRTKSIINHDDDDNSDGSDFGATEYN